jgi:hypothetical protein
LDLAAEVQILPPELADPSSLRDVEAVVAKEYVFVDEWDVDAPQEAVFEALADARTYPVGWTPVYFAGTTIGR